jgi:hypothetical protein
MGLRRSRTFSARQVRRTNRHFGVSLSGGAACGDDTPAGNHSQRPPRPSRCAL